MNQNIPLLALSVVGVLIAAYGVLVQQSIPLIATGIGVILFAWLLQEMSRRRS